MNILIVEDEFVSGFLLSELLSPFGQCTVVTDGRDAVDLLEHAYETNNCFDLVCLDIHVPGMDGQQVLKEIQRMENAKKNDGNHTTKVFMTTTQRDAKNIMAAFTTGCCQAYLTKPIDRVKLVYHLRQCQLVN